MMRNAPAFAPTQDQNSTGFRQVLEPAASDKRFAVFSPSVTAGRISYRSRRRRWSLPRLTAPKITWIPKPEQHQVQQHLAGHHQSCRLGLGGDVPEADSREDGDGEVDGVRTGQGFGEGRGLVDAHDEVRGGEEQQEQRRDDCKGLDGPDARIPRAEDGPHLPQFNDHSGQHRHPDRELDPHERGRVGAAIQRKDVVQGDHDHRGGQRRGAARGR